MVRPDVQHIHVVLVAVQLLKPCLPWGVSGRATYVCTATGLACARATRPAHIKHRCGTCPGAWESWSLEKGLCRRTSAQPSVAWRSRHPAGKAAPRTGLERFSAGTVAAAGVAHQDEHPGLAVPWPLGCACRWAQRPQRARMRQPAAAKLRRRKGWQEHKRWLEERAACGGMLLPAADACSWGGSNSILSQVFRSALLQAAS